MSCICGNDGDASVFEDEAQSTFRFARTRRHAFCSSIKLSSLITLLLLVVACSWIRPAAAIRVPFDNCLPESYIYTNPDIADDEVQLQWIPLYVEAVFDNINPSHNLQVTVWGNVTGRVGTDPLPEPGSLDWNNPELALHGKIQDVPFPDAAVRKATTLHSKVDVVTYEPHLENLNFCDSILNATCPLGPVFRNESLIYPEDLGLLPSFNLSKDFYSSYAFTTFAPTFLILYGDAAATTIGCVSATVTPSLGDIAWLLKFLPVFVLILVGFATAFAAIFSPWGTSDIFHWTSNYGRDPDLLRLVTPGFGDCLQYIQFIALTGGLTLEYPGFYQPVTSQGSWSALMFNESFVSGAEPWQSLRDGLYFTNSTYGLEAIAQLDGMSQVQDIWAGMMVWLLVIIGAVLLMVQIGFLGQWILRFLNNNPEEDLRAKNIPFSLGSIVRLVFSYFLLPIVSLSTFQLVVATRSPGYLVGLAVITLLLIIGFAVRLMYLIATTKPRAHLFDDLPTVLLYGPLYNTYSDEAAAFAVIPIMLTIMRGVAIGAVQPSGTAQVVILAVCEVIQMLTLHAFRPFHSWTSMNIYQTGFAAFRFIAIILMVAFSPSMGVTEGPKGWIGYAILLIHGSVLLFGFFLNALQTIVEVIARLCGAGGDDVRGQTRGGLSKIFGARQLARRMDRRGGASRQSQLSTTGMLDADKATKRGYGRLRSGSAGSMGILMNPQQRSTSALDARSVDAYSIPVGGGGGGGSAFTPTTPLGASTFSLPSPGQATRPQPTADPYYRPPRARRGTLEGAASSSPNRARDSVTSVDSATRRMSGPLDAEVDVPEAERVAPVAPAPLAAYAPVFAPRADYSTREVDFYYGVRGPALNSDGPGRRLGTGPADPTSPINTATGWLKSLFGGKTKEKGKGFEVVRSARMPPAMKAPGGEFSDEPPPEGIPVAMGVLRHGPIESDDEEETPKSKKSRPMTREGARGDLSDDDSEPRPDEEEDLEASKLSEEPPLLPDLDSGESFRVPSRIHSKASRHASQRTARMAPDDQDVPEVPEVPRKSSKRNSSVDRLLNFVPPSDNPRSDRSASRTRTGQVADETQSRPSTSARLPFDRTNSQRRLSGSSLTPTEDFSQIPSGGISADGDERPASFGYVHQRNISRIDPDQRVDLLGTAAEVVDGSRKPSPGGSSVSGRS